MTTIRDLMTDDHRACDDEFARMETAVVERNWPQADERCRLYKAAMERHLGAEERLLFPAFEKATGMLGGGPTEVMRREHDQIRDLIDDLLDSIKEGDEPGCRGCIETLLIMMQQHNMKEENILYPACDQHLKGEVGGICAALSGAIDRAKG